MTKFRLAFLIPGLLLTAAAHGAQGGDVSEADQVAHIQAMPVAQCQKDLRQLRYIHGHLRGMSAAEQKDYLIQVAASIQAQGIPLPPPPAPCSAPHLALEEKCGSLQQAKSQCELQSAAE